MSDTATADPKTQAEGGRWKRRAEARPGEILEAALDLFVEKGFAATRMEQIAQRAGVTKGTVYLYFPSKEALFRAAVTEALLPAVEQQERVAAGFEGSSAELLTVLVRQWWDTVGSTRLSCLPKLIMSEAANFPEEARFYRDQVMERSRRITQAVIRRGMERGEFRRDLDVALAARVAHSGLLGAVIYKHSLLVFDEEPFDFDEYFRTHVELFLRGILAAGEPRTDEDDKDASRHA